MQAVILAGGLATRLGALTAARPKSLLQVAGRPFIAWQLERIGRAGLRDVVLCIGHLGEQVRAFVGNGGDYGLSVRYSEDGPGPLGTAGALRRALPLLAESFVVTYGDSYLEFDYASPLADLDQHPEAEGTLAVYENHGRWDTSNVRLAGDRVERYAKNSGEQSFAHIDYGAMALRKAVIARLPANTVIGLDTLQTWLAERGVLRALRVDERFYEIGSRAGLAELECRLAQRQ
jgi:MurNAc alpha-1-phosphate uridylyltransferase